MQFIVDHMTPQYPDAFRLRHFNAMKDLKQALIVFDQRQRNEVKQKSSTIAYLEADEKKANMKTGEDRDKLPPADALMTFIEKVEQNKPV
jgi:hypothetical protein